MLSKLYGYAGKLLRVNLTDGDFKVEPLSKEMIRGFIGGRGINMRMLYSEVRGVDPLSPLNKLYISTGPLAGTGFPLGSRLNVSGKSPQTGLIGDSNVGGHFAAEMKYAGYDSIIIEGRSEKPIYIYIADGEVELKDASGIWGRRISDAYSEILRELGDWRAQIALIGPAAERLVRYSGIFFNLYRPAARTGMGALMASKNVKAIAVRGDGYVEVARPAEFERIVGEIEEETYAHPQFWPRRIMGTSRILMAANRLGILPGNHFKEPLLDQAFRVSGEYLALKYNVKNMSCFSCIVNCSRFFLVKDDEYSGLMGEGPEYEALAGMTVRIGNSDLDAGLKAISLLNDLGMDVISASEAISWAMELYESGALKKEEIGLELNWGNMDSVMKLIEMIARREGFGDILADGVAKASERLGKGKEIAMHVKGLEMIQVDPRGLKGYGLGFAVASRGADHLRSEPFIELSDDPRIGEAMFGEGEATLRLGVRGKGKLVAYYENICALVDSLEVCKNLAENMDLLNYERVAKLMRAVTGLDFTPEEVRDIGERIVNLERAFNVREGVTRADDRLPKRFLEERIARGPSAGQLMELDVMLDEYYEIRGWDRERGIPSRKKLIELGLEDVALDLEANGIYVP